MRKLLLPLLSCTSALLASCMPAQYVLVTDEARRWNVGEFSPAFSVTAPPGGKWYHALQGRGVSFLRYGDTEVHSVAAHAERVTVDKETTVEVFEASVKRHVEGGTNQGRFRFVRSDYRPLTVDVMLCVAYEAEVEDTGATRDRRALSFVVLGRICRHATRSGEGVDINVSERGRPEGGMSPQTREQAAQFFASLRAR